jgi:phospholipid-binding lipoprotein MlaA
MKVVWCALAMLVPLVGGCAMKGNPDPLEPINRISYKINDGLDKILLRPTSDVWKKVVPRPVREGITNVFDNLGYFNVIANDLLQGHFDDGFNGVGRMAVNTTVGIGGIFDPASKWGMPQRRNDFGITLGKWGAGPGPYLMLPLFGPSTFRDVPAIPFRSYTNPLHYVSMTWELETGITVVDLLNSRADLEPTMKLRDRAAVDPYVFMRDGYLQLRDQRIRGTTTRPSVEPGFYEEEEATTTRPASGTR